MTQTALIGTSTAKDHEHSHSKCYSQNVHSYQLDSHHDQIRPEAHHQNVSVEVKHVPLVEGVCSILTVRERTMLNANNKIF